MNKTTATTTKHKTRSFNIVFGIAGSIWLSVQSQFSVRVGRYVSWKLADISFRLFFPSVLQAFWLYFLSLVYFIFCMQSHEQSQPSIGTLIKNAVCAPSRAFGFVHSFIHFAILPFKIEHKNRQSTATKRRIQSERDEEKRKKKA